MASGVLKQNELVQETYTKGYIGIPGEFRTGHFADGLELAFALPTSRVTNVYTSGRRSFDDFFASSGFDVVGMTWCQLWSVHESLVILGGDNTGYGGQEERDQQSTHCSN